MCKDRKILMEEVIKRIEEADTAEIDEVLRAVGQRLRNMFPDWETVYLALPRNNPDERRRILKLVPRMMGEPEE